MDARGTSVRCVPGLRARWFWFMLGIGLALIGAGGCWLLLGRSLSVGATLIASGTLADSRLLVDRWRLAHGYGPFSDWRPGRRAYLAPIATFCIGLLLLFLVPGHTSPWIGLGIVLVSFSVTGVGVLAIRRAMLNTHPD